MTQTFQARAKVISTTLTPESILWKPFDATLDILIEVDVSSQFDGAVLDNVVTLHKIYRLRDSGQWVNFSMVRDKVETAPPRPDRMGERSGPG